MPSGSRLAALALPMLWRFQTSRVGRMPARLEIVSTIDMPVVDDDELLLLPLLPEAELAYWDEPAVNWAQYEVVILRSTWNYPDHIDEFLAWATRVSQVARLVNPVEIIEWN